VVDDLDGDLAAAVARFGRGVIVPPGVDPGGPWRDGLRLVVDEAVLADPAPAADVLRTAWAARHPIVVELAVTRDALRAPEVEARPACELAAGFRFAREELYSLVRATCSEWRPEGVRWGPALEAKRLGAEIGGPADVVLPDGRAAWCDGGPWLRAGSPEGEGGAGAASLGAAADGAVVVHRDVMAVGRLSPVVSASGAARPGPPLDPEQEAAVTDPSGAVRVIAPAGSGKTRTLAARLVHLVSAGGVPADLVTAVAYNKRAERELAGRVPGLERRVRTIHSLALRILERGGRVQVLDERAARRVAEEVVQREVGLRPRADRDQLAPYLEALDEVRVALRTPEVVEGRRDDVPGFAKVFPAYRERLDRAGAVDFGEMVYGALTVLLTDPSAREEARLGARHLLVDEYQDLTPAYLLLLRLLAAPTYQVFGVGDDDQTIYGYAGADPRFLVDYPSFVPGAADRPLATSYRCPPAVLQASGYLLARNEVRVPKAVRAASSVDDGLRVEVRPTAELAVRAADVVAGWLDAGAAPDDVCVLARVNAALLPVQVVLTARGLPVAPVLGPEILRRTGTTAVLSWIRLAVDPSRMARDDVVAAARRPGRGINRFTANALRRRWWSLADLRDLGEANGGRDGERLIAFADDVAALSAVAGSSDTAAVLAFLRDEIGLGRALDLLDGSRSRADRSSHRDDLAALEQLAALEPVPSAFEATLRGWLEPVSRAGASSGGGEGSGDGPEGDDAALVGATGVPGRVTLSSVHRVKGLEWDHVLVVGVDRNLLPHRLALEDDPVGGAEEERRVLHVAITRGRRQVVVLGAADRPSPFLAELDHAPTEAERTAAARTAQVERLARISRERSALVAVDDSPETARLVEALRSWRSARARDDGHPAYVVLSDAHLRGIAAARPTTLSDLARCPGIGPTKLDRYGEAILDVIEAASEGAA
jgi:DNA helicase-2/ATP-dependent DNA helicase PcrA